MRIHSVEILNVEVLILNSCPVFCKMAKVGRGILLAKDKRKMIREKILSFLGLAADSRSSG